MKKINPLVFLPATIFWAMVITGAVTGNETIIGAPCGEEIISGSITCGCAYPDPDFEKRCHLK